MEGMIRNNRGRLARLSGVVLLVTAALLASSCANSNKLAKKSQEQLTEGNPRKAYETALKAVAKDPYNANALAALGAAGNAVLAFDARRFRSLAPMDTLGAAEVSLAMDDLRYQTAQYGVALSSDSGLGDEERAVRSAAGAHFAAEGDALLAARRPKAAYEQFERAQRFVPNDVAVVERMARAHDLAVDRVLLLPYASDTRARIDTRQLSWDMFRNVSRVAEKRMKFTRLEDPGRVWSELFGVGPGRFVSEAAYVMGEEHEATRVAWTRIHGDRVDSHSESYRSTLYRREQSRQPDGSTVTRWRELPVSIRIEDRWVSVAVECEVHEVESRRLIARRSADRGAGWRAVLVMTDLPGEPGEYALYTPDQWNTVRDACRARTREWSEAMGSLTVETFVRSSRGKTRTIAVSGTGDSGYGSVRRSGRDYRVRYGNLPGESALLEAALEDAWKEVLAALEVSDRS